MGQLETLPDGRIRVRYWDVDGKRPQRTFEKGEKQKAARWLRERCEEVEAIRSGDQRQLVARREENRTVEEACRDYLAAHQCRESTRRKLTYNYGRFCRAFEGRRLQAIESYELQAWRQSLSPGLRHGMFQAVKQMFRQAHLWGWIPENPCLGIRNPPMPGQPMRPLPWESVLIAADEIEAEYAHIPILAAGTGLRPEEWIALHWTDVDLSARELRVERVYSDGELYELAKGETVKHRRQRRVVPLRAVVVEALARAVRRIDIPHVTPPLPGQQHPYLTLKKWRESVWTSALRAGGIEYQRPYDLRHTYATDSIAAGIDLFTLSRRMGTSLKEIDATYGHLANNAAERELDRLDSYDARRGAASG